ncbi:MAG: hypothetical protein IPH12_17410 [Saprospirales bacterium]|nr:hypothetical protein [Saprospirales bacterium]
MEMPVMIACWNLLIPIFDIYGGVVLVAASKRPLNLGKRKYASCTGPNTKSGFEFTFFARDFLFIQKVILVKKSRIIIDKVYFRFFTSFLALAFHNDGNRPGKMDNQTSALLSRGSETPAMLALVKNLTHAMIFCFWK